MGSCGQRFRASSPKVRSHCGARAPPSGPLASPARSLAVCVCAGLLSTTPKTRSGRSTIASACPVRARRGGPCNPSPGPSVPFLRIRNMKLREILWAKVARPDLRPGPRVPHPPGEQARQVSRGRGSSPRGLRLWGAHGKGRHQRRGWGGGAAVRDPVLRPPQVTEPIRQRHGSNSTLLASAGAAQTGR